MSTQDQQNWNHSFITPLAQSYAFYKIETNLKALYNLNLIPLDKISQTVGFIFLSNSTLHDESIKIWITPFVHS